MLLTQFAGRHLPPRSKLWVSADRDIIGVRTGALETTLEFSWPALRSTLDHTDYVLDLWLELIVRHWWRLAHDRRGYS